MAKTTTQIKDSFVKNPLPWIVLAGGAIYLASRGVKKVSELVSQGVQNKFETGSKDNPFAWRAFFGALPQGTKYTILTSASKEAIAKQIYDSFGFFSDDENKFKDAFRKLKTQAQVADIARYFSQKYSKDLLEFIKNGYGPFPNAGLSDADYNDVLKQVTKLPKLR
jgi:hypothetical protein